MRQTDRLFLTTNRMNRNFVGIRARCSQWSSEPRTRRCRYRFCCLCIRLFCSMCRRWNSLLQFWYIWNRYGHLGMKIVYNLNSLWRCSLFRSRCLWCGNPRYRSSRSESDENLRRQRRWNKCSLNWRVLRLSCRYRERSIVLRYRRIRRHKPGSRWCIRSGSGFCHRSS